MGLVWIIIKTPFFKINEKKLSLTDSVLVGSLYYI